MTAWLRGFLTALPWAAAACAFALAQKARADVHRDYAHVMHDAMTTHLSELRRVNRDWERYAQRQRGRSW